METGGTDGTLPVEELLEALESLQQQTSNETVLEPLTDFRTSWENWQPSPDTLLDTKVL